MDRMNPIDDPETLIVINELSELKITPPNIGLNQFDEKVEDVSSDDGNEETADDGDDEEQIIESVCNLNITSGDSEARQTTRDASPSVSYASKGPMVQKRSRTNVNASTAPYRKTNQKPDIVLKERIGVNKANHQGENVLLDLELDGIEEPKCNLGQFIDVATFLPELAQTTFDKQSNLSKNPVGEIKPTSGGKPGIPSLPDTSPTINDGAAVVFPRVVIYKKPTVLCMAIPQANIMIHPRLRKLGIYIPHVSLENNSRIEIENSESFEIFIQLSNSRAIRLRSPVMLSEANHKYQIDIPNQFVELRPFYGGKGNSGIESLLEDVTDKQIEDAISLVNGKDLTDLLKTYGPNEDSMLMHLCCKRDEPPLIRAQVFALVNRILSQTNPNTRANVIQKNSSGLSALDYTTVTNNRRLATFLADLYYVMGEDPTCPDLSGNTLLHMLARKGDASVDTLRALIALRYSQNGNDQNERGPYFSGVRNLKCFMPIHHAVMSRACPRNAIETLYRDMPACLTAETENGSLPIHLACQYSSDRSMIALLLNYNRDVINAKRNDGFTPLHLVASRNDGPADLSIGLIPLDEATQKTFICDLLNFGADKTIFVGGKYLPFDLVKANREMARSLLKTPERNIDGTIPNLGLNGMVGGQNQNGIQNIKTNCIQPPNNLELNYTNLSIKKENIDGDQASNSLIVVQVSEGAAMKNDIFLANTGSSMMAGQSQGSPIDTHNRPSSSASSFLSTLSPTSSVVMSGRDDPFICGGTTPNYTDSFNIGLDDSPHSSGGGGSQQHSPQSAVNNSFNALYNSPHDGLGRLSRASLSHPHTLSSASNPSTFYNCYDSLSDSDGERVGTGDSGNESPSSDNPTYNRSIIQQAFGQQPSARTTVEDNENRVLDVIAAQLYSHPTIQAVINGAEGTNENSCGVKHTVNQNNL